MSPAFLIRDAVVARGAQVTLYDPYYSVDELARFGFAPGTLDENPLADVIVLNTAHEAFVSTGFASWRKRGVRAVVDGRNVWSASEADAAGLVYIAAGVPAGGASANRS